MQIPHDAYVLVTDGRKMLLFRNVGDSRYPQLRTELVREQPSLPDHDQKSDAPGITSSSFGSGRSTYGSIDYHQRAEDRFAAGAADYLCEAALRNEFRTLIVAAPSRTLEELRKHYHKAVTDRIAGELPKDLVKMPVTDIERILIAA
jgi:protein required for attachment to host cells